MATHKSSVKRQRQSLKLRASNRTRRSVMRLRIKQLRSTVATKDFAGAQQLLPGIISMIDRSLQKGILPENTAARHKSRLTRLVNSVKSTTSAK